MYICSIKLKQSFKHHITMENLHPLLALLTFLMSMTENDTEPTIAPIMSIETENAYFTLFLN